MKFAHSPLPSDDKKRSSPENWGKFTSFRNITHSINQFMSRHCTEARATVLFLMTGMRHCSYCMQVCFVNVT